MDRRRRRRSGIMGFMLDGTARRKWYLNIFVGESDCSLRGNRDNMFWRVAGLLKG
jgi:hypothetical protein